MTTLMMALWALAQTPPPAMGAPTAAAPASLLGFPGLEAPTMDSALGSARQVGDVLWGPIRDAHMLLPGATDPTLPRPDNKLLGASMADIAVGKSSVPEWKYRLEAGGNFRQGNAQSTNYNAMFGGERQTDDSLLQFKLSTLYNQLNDAVSNQRHFGSLSYDRYLRGRWLAYAKAEIENDNARQIDLRMISSAGLGYRFIDDLTTRWVVRTGPTFTYLKASPIGLPSTSSTQAGWLVESQFRHLLANNSRFEWNATAYPNFASQQSFRIKNDLALLFPIGDAKNAWNWKIGARHEYTDGPPAGTKPNDSEVYFAIVFNSK
jgi:hypothetical protein